MSTNSTTKPTEAIPTLRLKPRGMELRSRSAVLEADDGENQMEDMTDILDDDVDKSPSQSQQSAVALPPPTAKRPLLGETTKSFTTSVTPATRDLSEKEKANLSKLNLLCLPKSATSANFRKGSIVNDAIIADFLITLRADLDDVTSRHAAQVKVFHSSIADLHLPGNGLIDESLNRLFKRVKALEESATQMVDAYEGSFDEIADLNKSYAAHSAKSARTQDQVTALADRIQAVEDTFTRTVVTPIPKPRTFPVRQVGLASTAIPSPIARPVASSSGTSAPVTSTIRRNGPTAPPPAKRARGNDGQSALSRTNMVRLKLRYPQKDIKAAAMVLMRFLPASMSSSIATVWHTKEPLYVTIRFRGSPFGSAHEAAARYVSLFDLGPPDARLEGMDAELWENSPSGARVEEMGGDLENDDAFEALVNGPANV